MITYDTIFSNCKEMSSYEGQRAVDANGDSLYPVVHMIDKDKPLIKSFTKQACNYIARKLSYLIADVAHGTDGFGITYIEDASIKVPDSADADIESIVGAYVMWQWLSNKLPDRAEVWKQVYETALSTLPRIYHRLKPTTDDYTPDGNGISNINI